MNTSPKAWKWTAALVVSLGLHAALAGTALMREPEIQIAGGGTTQLAIAGNAFEDQVAAGEVSEDIAPVEDQTPSEISPETMPDAVQAETVPEIVQAETVPDAVEAESVPELVPETVVAEFPEQSDLVEAEQPVAEAEEVTAEPVEMPPPPKEVAEPVETVEQLAAVVDVPVPTPRPKYTPKPVKAEPTPKKAAPKPVAKQRASGSQGRDRQNAKRGASTADNNGRSASSGRTARASREGNAAVSNYPGNIQSRMQRAVRSLRKPRDAGRIMHVRITIMKSGAVGGASVARSSGSPAFDQKVLRRIRGVRYPPIPPAAGRSSWNFVVPVG